MWMLKGQTAYSLANENSANAIASCAAMRTRRPLPNLSNCKITLFTGGSTAAAAGSPAGHSRTDGVNTVVYRGGLNHIYELSLGVDGLWHKGDILNNGSVAASNPAAYRRSDHYNSVVYRSVDGRILELYLDGGWHVGDLSGAISWPENPVGNPSAYVRHDGTNVVVYAGANGHIYEIANIAGGWYRNDLSVAAGATANTISNMEIAGGDPVGYVRSDGASAVVYRSLDDHIRDLYLDSTGWHPEDLWAQSGSTVHAAGTPSAYVRSDGVSSVVYRSTDNHLRELTMTAVFLQVSNSVARSWSAWDLTATAGAPASAGNPSAYVRADDINSVVYRDVGGHLRELTQDALNGGPWLPWDFYAGTGSAAASGDAFGYLRSDMVDAVVFKTVDGHLRELSATHAPGTSWILTDMAAN